MNYLSKSIFLLFLMIVVINSAYSQRYKMHDNYNLIPVNPSGNNHLLDSVIRYNFTVIMNDGTILDALKYIPVGTPPAEGWPTIIMVHGFGDSKETLDAIAKAQAEYGYYVTTFSMRGQGNSTGLSNLISTTEAQDMFQFVNYIKNDAAGGVNPNNILVMGGSQGGLIPFMAACNGMNVKTIISALAPPNFASSWIENGSIKMTCLWTMDYTPDTARYTPLVASMRQWILNNNKPSWDSLALRLPQNRDFMDIVHNNTVPILIEGSWQDKFFNASGIIQASNNLNSVFRLYLGAVQGHGGDSSPTENTWHMQFFNDWFLYWLFNTGSLNEFKYQYAYTTYPRVNNAWTFVHDSSNVTLSQVPSVLRLYFNSGHMLKSTVNPNVNDTVVLRNHITGGLTMQEAIDEEFTGTNFNSKFEVNSIYFETDPLTSNITWLGTPVISLNYLSTGNTFCQYNFEVFDVKSNGTSEFVNRFNFTDRNYTANSIKTALFNGQAHSHLFTTGNKIRIVVTNLDRTPSDSAFLGTNPFVLPVLINSNNTIKLSAESYVDFPVKDVITSVNGNESSSVKNFVLMQNYPNPFNPVTNIEYNLDASALVNLSVYDIQGRLVKTLVDNFQNSGKYRISFDGTSFASGIYFYKITTGQNEEVKRMILIK